MDSPNRSEKRRPGWSGIGQACYRMAFVTGYTEMMALDVTSKTDDISMKRFKFMDDYVCGKGKGMFF